MKDLSRFGWPKTTPSGHTYKAPENMHDLRQRMWDAMMADIECWDLVECPAEPTWEMVAIALNEIDRLNVKLREAGLELDHRSMVYE